MRATHGCSDEMTRVAPNPVMEWLDLRQLTQYAAISERTLRSWIHDSASPLPASQVGGKIFVRRRDFDEYLERHRIRTAESVSKVVEEIFAGVVAD